MSNLEKMTPMQIRSRKADQGRICVITAYDFTFARLVDAAGVDIVLAGDSMANTMLGLESTVPVTVAQMIHHATAVVRGVQHAVTVADMPFGSVQTGVSGTLENCVRVFKESGENRGRDPVGRGDQRGSGSRYTGDGSCGPDSAVPFDAGRAESAGTGRGKRPAHPGGGR